MKASEMIVDTKLSQFAKTDYVDLAIEQYFDWLYHQVEGDLGGCGHRILSFYLHQMEFYWTVDNDGNRAEDGKELRKKYILERAKKSGKAVKKMLREILSGPCSLLEVMVAMCLRCENEILYNSEEETHAGWLYLKMLESMGLKEAIDSKIDSKWIGKIREAGRKVLDREYDKDGKGGLFLCKKAKEKDLREVEMWYQMMIFLRGEGV